MNAKKVQKLISSRKVSNILFLSTTSSSVIIALTIQLVNDPGSNSQELAIYIYRVARWLLYLNWQTAFQVIIILGMTDFCMHKGSFGFRSITLWGVL
jgi:hypothetical protein